MCGVPARKARRQNIVKRGFLAVFSRDLDESCDQIATEMIS